MDEFTKQLVTHFIDISSTLDRRLATLEGERRILYTCLALLVGVVTGDKASFI